MSHRLVFYEPVQRLQDMAAFKIALDLWLYYVSCERLGLANLLLDRICITDSYRTREVDVRRMVDVLKLPTSIEGSIKTNVKSICAQVLSLSSYCRDQVFFRDLRVEQSLSTFVWKPDGTIDYEKIITKVIKSDQLNERQKFALMCEYCMEDEIRRAWPLLADRQFLDDAQFDSSPLMVYWNCVMKGDFSEMTVADEEAARNLVFGNTRARNPNAINFFFNRMSSEDRLTNGIRLMERGGAKMAKFLLPKFSENEQLALFSRENFFIRLMKIFVFTETQMNVEYALETWLYVRNTVTETQFAIMLEEFSKHDDHHVHELLVQVWRCSPVSLKMFVYQLPLDGQFIYRLCIRPSYVSKFDFRQREDGLLIEVLRDAKPSFRTELWRRYWPEIVNLSRPANLRAIANLCLTENETEQFKRTVMSETQCRIYFTNLIVYGKYSDLNMFLDMFVGGEKTQRNEVSRLLLEGMSDLSLIAVKCELTEAAVNALNDFLAQVFADDSGPLNRFKTNVILSCFIPHDLRIRFELVRIFNVLERLCDEQTLTRAKEEIVLRCKAAAVDSQTAYCVEQKPEWSMLLAWCLGCDEKVDEFNRSVLTASLTG